MYLQRQFQQKRRRFTTGLLFCLLALWRLLLLFAHASAVYYLCFSNASSIHSALKGTAVHPLDESQGLSRSVFCHLQSKRITKNRSFIAAPIFQLFKKLRGPSTTFFVLQFRSVRLSLQVPSQQQLVPRLLKIECWHYYSAWHGHDHLDERVPMEAADDGTGD
jgi:uncharacterized CHY-type Zn-finger protein